MGCNLVNQLRHQLSWKVMPPTLDLDQTRTRNVGGRVTATLNTDQWIADAMKNQHRQEIDLMRSRRSPSAMMAAYWRVVPSG